MKNLVKISTIISITAAAAFAQERPRLFDNFDTSRGVRVQQQPRPITPAATAARTVRSPAPGKQVHYPPSPPAGDGYKNRVATSPMTSNPLIKKTAQVTMSVNEGYSQREQPRPVESIRLMTGAGSYLRGYSTGDTLIDAYIVDSSRRYGIDPLLIYSQMNQESSFKLRATSNKGASGLMQLMPATARRLGVTNIYDPRDNIEGGVKYMRILLDMFNGDINLALAGYNAGEGAVLKYGYQIPPYTETQDYVRRISARYRSISGPTTAGAVQPAYQQNTPRSIPVSNRPPTRFEPQTVTIRYSDGRTKLLNK